MLSDMKLLFQAQKRTAELVIGRCGYCPKRGRIADYLAHMGSYDIYPLSGGPRKIQNYLTLIKPFDGLIWTSVAASVVATTLTLVMIDKLSASWKPWTSKIPPHLSTQNIYKIQVSIINKTIVIDAFIVFGMVLDKGLELDQGVRSQIAKAKLIMLAEWMLLAFLISLSYRSVLLATIVSPEYEKPIDTIQAEFLAIKHENRILGHSSNPVCGFVKFCAVGEPAWLFLEPDTGLDHWPRILLSCFRARTFESRTCSRVTSQYLPSTARPLPNC